MPFLVPYSDINYFVYEIPFATLAWQCDYTFEHRKDNIVERVKWDRIMQLHVDHHFYCMEADGAYVDIYKLEEKIKKEGTDPEKEQDLEELKAYRTFVISKADFIKALPWSSGFVAASVQCYEVREEWAQYLADNHVQIGNN